METKKQVLYIAYDGMTDPLGQSQVLSYLRLLSKKKYSFHVLSFDKPDLYAVGKTQVESFIEAYDIKWYSLPYSNTPPILSTAKNIQAGKRMIRKICKANKIELVHCRGYIPAIMGEWVKKKYGAKFLFDMRGWWPDERLESGLWDSPFYKPVYHYFKRRERGFFKNADSVISLTHIGKKYIVEHKLKEEQKTHIIPTCVNFEMFPPYDESVRNAMREKLQIPSQCTVMVYSGSLGGNYRTDLVLKFFNHLLRKDADSMFMFLTHTPKHLAEAEIEKSGLDKHKFVIVSAAYHEVSSYLMAADIGVVMYNTDFSVIGRSPTKLGEYWACGLKMLSAKGIGDLEYIHSLYPQSGCLIQNMNDDTEYEKAIEQLLQLHTTKEQLRSYAKDYYDLEKGVEKYTRVYKQLLG